MKAIKPLAGYKGDNVADARPDKWKFLRLAGTPIIRLKHFNTTIYIEPRPPHCDRGNWVAKIDTQDLHLDWADAWPRYYFDIHRAKQECEAFLAKREALGQFKESADAQA